MQSQDTLTAPRSFADDPSIQKRRWTLLIILNLFTFMATLDGSIVNIALPSISQTLELPVAQTEWVVTSYLMVICAAILFFGKLGDIFGKIKVFKWGMLLFLIGSLLCGLSNTLITLILSRAVQALGAAMTMANNQGIVTEIFPKNERGKALGLIGTFVSLGSIAGPSLGGVIVSGLGWQYIFWVNVPIGLAAVIIAWRLLPKDVSLLKVKIDASGSILFTLFILALFSGLLLGQQTGYNNPWIIASFIASVFVLAAFLSVEARKAEPLLQLSLFKNPLFSLSILCGFLTFTANFAYNILSPFYLQSILNLSPFHAGLVLMVFPVIMVIVSPLSGALSDKIGSELLTFVGLLLMFATHIGLASLHDGSPLSIVILLIAMLGLGNGIFQPGNNSLIMSQAPRSQLGVAGSVNSLVRNVGMVTGITVATTVLFHTMSTKAGYRVTDLIPGRPDIFLFGMKAAYTTSAVICLVAALLTGLRLWSARRKKHEADKKDLSTVMQ